jgi:hypothetical protein
MMLTVEVQRYRKGNEANGKFAIAYFAIFVDKTNPDTTIFCPFLFT